MALFICTIGIDRARAALTMANMAYNMKWWLWLDSQVIST
jgi:IS5 family transposase